MRKRRISTREIYKWKARLTVHGRQQQHGVNFLDTYSPVVTWTSIRFFLLVCLCQGWASKQLDFVLAYPQVPVECDMYLELPKGFTYKGDRKSHVLKLIKNVYGTRQGARVWSTFLKKGLIRQGFVQSKIDECVFY